MLWVLTCERDTCVQLVCLWVGGGGREAEADWERLGDRNKGCQPEDSPEAQVLPPSLLSDPGESLPSPSISDHL